MNKKSENILKEFEEKKFLYQGLAEKISHLLNSLIKENVKPHQIQFRVKLKDSLAKKLIRKNYKYSSLTEITDIIGFRIVTYFEDDIDTIENIISTEFDIDKKNSVDKRNLEVDKFGYRSAHFVASLNKDRLRLTEYEKYKGLKFEIQIRSILQHSWAEIEHDIGYKGASEIPKTAKRTFYRVAALLEQADIEFTKLRKEISDYEDIVEQKITDKISNVSIDKSSLIAFIKNSKIIDNIERKIEEKYKCVCDKMVDSDFMGSSQLIEDLESLNIKNIKDLEKSLISNEEKIINEQKEFLESLTQKDKQTNEDITFIKGAPLLWLRNHLMKE